MKTPGDKRTSAFDMVCISYISVKYSQRNIVFYKTIVETFTFIVNEYVIV